MKTRKRDDNPRATQAIRESKPPMNNETNVMSTSKPHALRRLYDWTLELAEHPRAVWALFFVAIAEATFFPIPTDILLLAMAMAVPNRAMWYAVVNTVGSVVGAVIGYGLGLGLWTAIDSFFYRYVPGFTQEKFDAMAQSFAENTFATIFTAGFTPIPFKVFTIAAGAAAVPIAAFLLGALISRALRYGILAALIMWFGPTIKLWIDRYFNTITIVVTVLLLIGFYFWQQSH